MNIAELKLERLKKLLTRDVLEELGSEQHEIMPPDDADEVYGILYNRPQFIRQGPFQDRGEVLYYLN